MKITQGLSLAFVCLLSACGGDKTLESCLDVETVAKDQQIFSGVSRDLISTSASKGQLAVACHNCYDYFESSSAASVAIIESAIDQGADLIELDLVFDSSDNQVWVSHGTNNVLVSFEEVINNISFLEQDQMLFLEIKGKDFQTEDIRYLLSTLVNVTNTQGQPAYANQQRLTIIRSFANFDDLSLIREVLNEAEFSEIKPYVKLSKLLRKSSLASSLKQVQHSHQCGIHMVEFNAELDTDVLRELGYLAKAYGLAVNVFTLYPWNYAYYLEELAPYLDVVTVEAMRADTENLDGDTIYNKIKDFFGADN